MLTIRPECPEDYLAIEQVNRLAFEGEHEARLVRMLRLRPDFIPALSLVAEKDQTIVGHILFSIVYIHSSGGDLPLLSLAPMAVRPEFQRQGIGSRLVKEGLRRCKHLHAHLYPGSEGPTAVVVLGHPDFYPRFGFKPAGELGIECPFDAPPEAWMVYELVPGALEGIQGMVEYPPEFRV